MDTSSVEVARLSKSFYKPPLWPLKPVLGILLREGSPYISTQRSVRQVTVQTGRSEPFGPDGTMY